AGWFPNLKSFLILIWILVAVSLVAPAPLAPEGHLLKMPTQYARDWLFNFWVPIANASGGWTNLVFVAFTVVLVLPPFLFRDRGFHIFEKETNSRGVCWHLKLGFVVLSVALSFFVGFGIVRQLGVETQGVVRLSWRYAPKVV